MRNRRVGTVSMGFLLAGLGILLLYSQFNGRSSFDLLVKWWPAIFFLLGIEILLYTFLAKEEQPRLTYDIFSIFIVLILVFCGIGIYGLTHTGIISRVSMMIAAENYVLEIPAEEIALDDSVKKVVIKSPSHANLAVRTGTGKVLSAYGTAYVTADTRENAEKILTDNSMTSHQAGDTLYLSFNLPVSGSDFGYHARITGYTLIVPADRQVEIDAASHLEIAVDKLENDWLIDSSGSVEIRINNEVDLTLMTMVRNSGNLRGNVAWDIEEQDSVDVQEHEKDITGKVIFGEGKHRISIISRSEVTANKI